MRPIRTRRSGGDTAPQRLRFLCDVPLLSDRIAMPAYRLAVCLVLFHTLVRRGRVPPDPRSSTHHESSGKPWQGLVEPAFLRRTVLLKQTSPCRVPAPLPYSTRRMPALRL